MSTQSKGPGYEVHIQYRKPGKRAQSYELESWVYYCDGVVQASGEQTMAVARRQVRHAVAGALRSARFRGLSITVGCTPKVIRDQED